MKTTFAILLLSLCIGAAQAAKLESVQVLDRDYIQVHILDGKVIFNDHGKGSSAFAGHGHQENQDQVVLFKPVLNKQAAQRSPNWTIISTDDPNYADTGKHPSACHRKTKINGHSEQGWDTKNNDWHNEFTYEHFLYLKLPHSLQQGKTYTLKIANAVNADKESHSFTFDFYNSPSEAIHVNLNGYFNTVTHKAADLYSWMGDGGPRNYKAFEGNKVYLYNTATKKAHEVGSVKFWQKSAVDVDMFNLTQSDVWTIDANTVVPKGTYRFAVEGVGCSQDFSVQDDVYGIPFKISVKGYYYMRIGEEKRDDIIPVPRQPRYIPGKHPENTTVYLTTMHPYHPEWKRFVGGDKWDKPDAWLKYRKPGNPTNPNAWGGHSDALDWDRHLSHVANIYDMLLPFILCNGRQDEDNLGIAESNNKIPDLLDEARNEVDFWLRLRDGEAYSHGLTNPNKKNQLFQAAPTALAAWANAVNCAMLAECFRINKNRTLMAYYRDEAIKAYNFASNMKNQMLDTTMGLSDGPARGRDLKMTAAACLFNVTGKKEYEDVVNQESHCVANDSAITGQKVGNQIYATAIYLCTPHKIQYPELQKRMRASVIHQAKVMEANLSLKRPSRRSLRYKTGWFRSAQNVQLSIIAHHQSTDAEQLFFLKALLLEADYGLGRNPLNMIHMTTATTELAQKRSVQGAYTSGRNDGSPGMHPGHTPYMNLYDWGNGMLMGRPSKLAEKCYPANFVKTWPHGEGYFNTRYVYAHNEFTPRQTMRGKMALYAYLHGLK